MTQWKSVSWYSGVTLFVSVFSHYFLSCHWSPPKRAWLCPLQIFSLDIYVHWKYSPWTFSSLCWTVPVLSGFPHRRVAPVTSSSLWLFDVSLILRSPKLDTEIQLWPVHGWVEGRDDLPWPADLPPPNAAHLSWWQWHMGDTCSAYHPPVLPCLFLLSCFPAGKSSAYCVLKLLSPCAGLCTSRVHYTMNIAS